MSTATARRMSRTTARADGDAQGNACDADDDNDGVADTTDLCPLLAGAAGNRGCPAPAPAPDLTKPGLVLRLSSSAFKASGPKAGTKVSFALSEASSVRFTVERRTTGRKVGGKCKAKTKANKNRSRCTRWVKVKGSITVVGKAGQNSYKFRGRIGAKKLKVARYRLNGQATDAAGNRSAIKRKSFRIVR